MYARVPWPTTWRRATYRLLKLFEELVGLFLLLATGARLHGAVCRHDRVEDVRDAVGGHCGRGLLAANGGGGSGGGQRGGAGGGGAHALATPGADAEGQAGGGGRKGTVGWVVWLAEGVRRSSKVGASGLGCQSAGRRVRSPVGAKPRPPKL